VLDYIMNSTTLVSASTPSVEQRLTQLVEILQNLNETETSELFKLVYRSKCPYTRNNNGVFINLSWLSEPMIENIERFASFCFQSRHEIHKYEELCQKMNQSIQSSAAAAGAGAFHTTKSTTTRCAVAAATATTTIAVINSVIITCQLLHAVLFVEEKVCQNGDL
jgi:hypothetical protein